MLEPDKERLRIYPSQNGWQLSIDRWNEEAQRWEDGKSWVFQDQEILLQEVAARLD